MSKSEEEIEEWKKYRKSVYEQKSKSEDDFEKYITFISSGALGLTLTLINQTIPLQESIFIWIILLGWILLVLTLFLNLISHYLSSRYNEKTIEDIDNDFDYNILIKNVDNRNNILHCLNIISLITLGFGIILIILFISINLYY